MNGGCDGMMTNQMTIILYQLGNNMARKLPQIYVKNR